MSHLRIKICGITNAADGLQAAQLGADAVGVNFYAQSPRHVDAATARSILSELPLFVDAVGLFVNQPMDEMLQTVSRFSRIRIIQWHGENREPSDLTPLQLIVAFSVRQKSDLLEITRYLDSCRELGRLPAAILIDAKVQGQYGGTGQTAPWDLLADFRPCVPLMLAGGLTPENVAEAVRIVRPYAVDVASGVEQSPGRKDAEKMRRFMANAREAAARCS